jgi:hypothetical protein
LQHGIQWIVPAEWNYFNAAFKSIAPAEWDVLRRGIWINRAGRMGCIAARHLNKSRRPNGINFGAAFKLIVPAEWIEMEVAEQHWRKHWPNEEKKWKRGIDKRATQMDGMGARHWRNRRLKKNIGVVEQKSWIRSSRRASSIIHGAPLKDGAGRED